MKYFLKKEFICQHYFFVHKYYDIIKYHFIRLLSYYLVEAHKIAFLLPYVLLNVSETLKASKIRG
jgi:hypothetical protein